MNRKGWTLPETIITIIVIAILALVVFPRILALGCKTKEATLRGELAQLRGAIALFEADCGDYPLRLEDVQQRPENDKGGTGLTIDLKAWKGPYYNVTPHGMLPPDPVTGEPDWKYTPSKGDIRSASTKTALNGTKYNEW